ncbi:hypothetical protein [Brachybacterium paraconglomeratum]|uniref:hypothetical protein n=1 Tax=Brachybacterium paraconglomeratum TaxID=173362 RepID=UPI00223BFE3C|nr:hypothetical protein [Brachybacterium paraconglomeratum]MCT1436245.1 hypothetical protein [Brachybacterium paraconglomeratum]
MTGQQLSPNRHRHPVEPAAVIVRTITTRCEIAPDAYDCVRVVVIRDGSALPTGDVPSAPLASRRAQGLPAQVDDPSVLAELRDLCGLPQSAARTGGGSETAAE